MEVIQRILLVEDDKELALAIRETLELGQFDCHHVLDGQLAINYLERNPVDLILCDVNLPKINGFQFINYVQRKLIDIPVILMTAYGAIADAIRAIQLGAKDYLVKPFSPDDLLKKIKQITPQIMLDKPIAEDDSSKRILQIAKKAAESDVTVLIAGESGTGKEVLAHYIHTNSSRREKPFIAVNCAAIPENMLEATLFGYEKGAFTGAVKAFPGKFEQAQGGTLLLDEISEMDLMLQAKLLRVLQEREVERIGSTKTIELDVRIIATTNRDLKQYVNDKKFREDLYYRLNVFPLKWQPLRMRPSDIIPLATHLLNKHAKNLGKKVPEISDSAIQMLQAYSWPGNIREMDNIIQRALVLCCDNLIMPDDLQLEDLDERNHLYDSVAEVDNESISNLSSEECSVIIATLKKEQGNIKQAAETLGISEQALQHQIAVMQKAGKITQGVFQ